LLLDIACARCVDAQMISVTEQHFPLTKPFTISRGTKTEAAVLTVRITRSGHTGMGECVPCLRYGHILASIRAKIEALPQKISRADLQSALPAGPARNAVDCAL
jgi:L-alanine-DL-glutamate epimerase-like enolase superfamily enzyme